MVFNSWSKQTKFRKKSKEEVNAIVIAAGMASCFFPMRPQAPKSRNKAWLTLGSSTFITGLHIEYILKYILLLFINLVKHSTHFNKHWISVLMSGKELPFQVVSCWTLWDFTSAQPLFLLCRLRVLNLKFDFQNVQIQNTWRTDAMLWLENSRHQLVGLVTVKLQAN